MHYNRYYEPLAETNPEVKKIYTLFDETAQKVQKILARRTETPALNAADSFDTITKAKEQTAAILEGIVKSAATKRSELLQEFYGTTGKESISDAREAVDYLQTLN